MARSTVRKFRSMDGIARSTRIFFFTPVLEIGLEGLPVADAPKCHLQRHRGRSNRGYY